MAIPELTESGHSQGSSREIPHKHRLQVLCALSLLVNFAVIKAPAAVCFMPVPVGATMTSRSAVPALRTNDTTRTLSTTNHPIHKQSTPANSCRNSGGTTVSESVTSTDNGGTAVQGKAATSTRASGNAAEGKAATSTRASGNAVEGKAATSTRASGNAVEGKAATSTRASGNAVEGKAATLTHPSGTPVAGSAVTSTHPSGTPVAGSAATSTRASTPAEGSAAASTVTRIAKTKTHSTEMDTSVIGATPDPTGSLISVKPSQNTTTNSLDEQTPDKEPESTQPHNRIDNLMSHIGTTQAIPGLSAAKSSIIGSVDAQSMSASYYWTIVLANSGKSQREAIMHIALPDGACVSGATLWVSGVAQEAAFAGTSQVSAAYEWVKNGRQPVAPLVIPDPLIVTEERPGHVLVKAAPVNPHGGEMKLMLEFTAPMQVEHGEASLMLPHIEDSNFAVNHLHDLELESATAVSSNESEVRVEPRAKCLLLKGSIASEKLASLKIAVNNVYPTPFATIATHSPEGTYVLATPNIDQQGHYSLDLEKLDSKPKCKILYSKAAEHRVSTLWAVTQVHELLRQAAAKTLEAASLRNNTAVATVVQWSGPYQRVPQELGNQQTQAMFRSASSAQLSQDQRESSGVSTAPESNTYDQIQAALVAANVITMQAIQLGSAYRVVSSVTGATVLEKDSDYAAMGLSRDRSLTIAFAGQRLSAITGPRASAVAPSLSPPMPGSIAPAPSLSPPMPASIAPAPNLNPRMPGSFEPAPSPNLPPLVNRKSTLAPRLVIPVTQPAVTFDEVSVSTFAQPQVNRAPVPDTVPLSSQQALAPAGDQSVRKVQMAPTPRQPVTARARVGAVKAPTPLAVTKPATTIESTPSTKTESTACTIERTTSLLPAVTVADAEEPAKVTEVVGAPESIDRQTAVLTYVLQLLCGTLGLAVLLDLLIRGCGWLKLRQSTIGQ